MKILPIVNPILKIPKQVTLGADIVGHVDIVTIGGSSTTILRQGTRKKPLSKIA